jgi:predicted homoserine dehydrogenase-like protein
MVIGGFCTYGLNDNVAAARGDEALPIALSEGCVLRRDIRKGRCCPSTQMLSFHYVDAAPGGLAEELWREQSLLWTVGEESARQDLSLASS